MKDDHKKKNRNKLITTAVAIFLFGMLFQSFINPVRLVTKLINPDAATIASLKKIAILPEDEPAIFPVIDAEILKNNDEILYKDVQNGDLFVIYNDKTIIYRESTNKIINIININLDQVTE